MADVVYRSEENESGDKKLHERKLLDQLHHSEVGSDLIVLKGKNVLL